MLAQSARALTKNTNLGSVVMLFALFGMFYFMLTLNNNKAMDLYLHNPTGGIFNYKQHKTGLDSIEHEAPDINRTKADQTQGAGKHFLTFHTENIISAPNVDFLNGLQSSCFYTNTNQRLRLRCLPSVLLAGFSKSGTTDLHHSIAEHPHIFVGTKGKEVHFWDNKFKKKRLTVGDYTRSYNDGTSLAPIIQNCCLERGDTDSKSKWCLNNTEECSSTRSESNQDIQSTCRAFREMVVSGKACPVTLIDSSPATAWLGDYWDIEPANAGLDFPAVLTSGKVAHVLSYPKIILIMREPVARLWSDYRFISKLNQHPISADEFHDMVTRSIGWWQKCVQILPVIRCTYGKNYEATPIESLFMSHRHSWEKLAVLRLRIGLYALHLQHWLNNIPRENFRFIRFEDYAMNKSRIVNEEIYPFLGLSPIRDTIKQTKDPKKKNEFGADVTMHSETRELLIEFYRPFNEALAELLNDTAFLWHE